MPGYISLQYGPGMGDLLVSLAILGLNCGVPIQVVLLWGQGRHTGLPLPISRTTQPEVRRCQFKRRLRKPDGAVL